MPRSVDSEENPKKRATRTRATRASGKTAVTKKRAARKTTTKKAAAKKAAKKRAPAKAKVSTEERVSKAAESGRKAPTPLAATKAKKRATRKHLIVVGVLLAVGIGASAAVGFTDAGEIDVLRAIEERNERIKASGGPEQIVPAISAEKERQPDGGLVGRGVGTQAPKPPAPTGSSTATSTATSTASSTAQTATSTTAVASSSPDVIEEENVEATEPEPAIEETDPITDDAPLTEAN